MLEPDTGSAGGKLKNTTSMIAVMTTTMFAIHPIAPGSLKRRLSGKAWAERFRKSSMIQGMAKETICKMMQLFKIALNAAEDPRYMQPKTRIQNALISRLHTGTSKWG